MLQNGTPFEDQAEWVFILKIFPFNGTIQIFYGKRKFQEKGNPLLFKPALKSSLLQQKKTIAGYFTVSTKRTEMFCGKGR
jgi:hypothetical protein